MARRIAIKRRSRKGPGPPRRKPHPSNDESTEKLNVWVPVRSSWIKALRFVPGPVRGRGPHLVQPKRLVGWVDMRVKKSLGYDYQYGDGQNIYLLQFKDWRTAASKGVFWWTRWTRIYSPARKIAPRG